jgi:hypothetical protein
MGIESWYDPTLHRRHPPEHLTIPPLTLDTHLQPLVLLLQLGVPACVIPMMMGVENIVQTPAPVLQRYKSPSHKTLKCPPGHMQST